MQWDVQIHEIRREWPCVHQLGNCKEREDKTGKTSSMKREKNQVKCIQSYTKYKCPEFLYQKTEECQTVSTVCSFLFYSAGNQIQGPAHASQMLYH